MTSHSISDAADLWQKLDDPSATAPVRRAAIAFAQRALATPIRFMNTGAHPDDETSEMLAALRYRDGLSLSFACSTRGEGGQNAISDLRGAALAVLRTAEMEAAAQVLDMRLYWLCYDIDDSIRDFGFSKSGVDTMARWGRDRLLRHFVDAIRSECPDIICPTFLDVPGQHGHHRAMTEAAHIVFDAAADPSFDSELPPWAVSKLYLPAWSGGGGAYDDAEAPPPATITINGQGRDENLDLSWTNIGQISRGSHASQDMGHWVKPENERDWPLHLAASRVGNDHSAISDNLPRNFNDIGGAEFRALDKHIAAICASEPDADEIGKRAANAYQEAAQLTAKTHGVKRRLEETKHRLIALAALCRGVDRRVDIKPVGPHKWQVGSKSTVSLDADDDWSFDDGVLSTSAINYITNPPRGYDPFNPVGPKFVLANFDLGGSAVVLPALTGWPSPMPQPALDLPQTFAIRDTTSSAPIAFDDLAPDVSIIAPKGWDVSQNVVHPATKLQEGKYDLSFQKDGKGTFAVTRIDTPRGIRYHSDHAKMRVLAVNLQRPQAKIGYVGGGRDKALEYLRAAQFDITDLSNIENLSAQLREFDTILIGVFAFRFAAALAGTHAALNDWVSAGGNLVTLYHRPGDNWQAEKLPAAIEIGSPSLRYRVTDEKAHVDIIAPEHPILNTPNKITNKDWEGWDKERGLYFAKSWDARFEALVSLADPEEAPHEGALLSAKIGKGRFTHVALNLHHQLEALTPGAYRLMANLLNNTNA